MASQIIMMTRLKNMMTIDHALQVVARLEGEGGALATRAGGGPGTSGVRLVWMIRGGDQQQC